MKSLVYARLSSSFSMGIGKKRIAHIVTFFHTKQAFFGKSVQIHLKSMLKKVHKLSFLHYDPNDPIKSPTLIVNSREVDTYLKIIRTSQRINMKAS